MTSPRPIYWYHSKANLIWPDGSFNGKKPKLLKITRRS